jgi:DNA processing protein
MEPDDLALWLRLVATPGVGNTTARRLLAAFGLPETIFAQSSESLRQVVTAAQTQALRTPPPGWQDLVQTTQTWLQAQPDTRRVWALGDADYPQALLNMEDPPILLHAMGVPEAWGAHGLNSASNACIAMVGSRNPSPQGLVNARQFATSLSQVGLTIVSGLALGVDGAAHEGALEGPKHNPIATIAVVGTGLDRVYPRQHRDLAHRITQNGILLSEYVLGTPPLSAHFPMRNRIIAGLSRGTLVVEATLQSGSLITARLASEQGSEVFAIPGSIHAPHAKGCHALIKQGAKLVETAQDVIEELQRSTQHWGAAMQAAFSEKASANASNPPLDKAASFLDADDVLAALGFDPVGLDALQARTGMDTPTLQAKLMGLELQGQVARLPGGLFQRQSLV